MVWVRAASGFRISITASATPFAVFLVIFATALAIVRRRRYYFNEVASWNVKVAVATILTSVLLLIVTLYRPCPG